MRDFTLTIYKKLLESLLRQEYSFYTFQEYCEGKATSKYIILRHDVDLKAALANETAKIESELGIRASYYFRVVSQSNKPDIIQNIVSLGHEIGYHYEDLSITQGNINEAIKHFERQLDYFRRFYPVVTICMHGSPASSYDNRDLWKSYNYHDFGIIGEPYFDMNFNEIFYLTDTGRCWDGAKYSVRDKVKSDFRQSFHSTRDVMVAAENGTLPDKIMITTHPQRWTNSPFAWLAEFLVQNLKNMIKQFIVIFRT
ncbi:MAG: hypothetical protein H6Q20_1836 [Bacteroidetes bacterium]|nr:hypothetical protein [Bacteroidota bacterium]